MGRGTPGKARPKAKRKPARRKPTKAEYERRLIDAARRDLGLDDVIQGADKPTLAKPSVVVQDKAGDWLFIRAITRPDTPLAYFTVVVREYENGQRQMVTAHERHSNQTKKTLEVDTTYLPTALGLRPPTEGSTDPQGPDSPNIDPDDPEVKCFSTMARHVSPHSFERFELGKIGTGEEVQAYGWHLYFLTHDDVEDHYKRSLGGVYWRIGTQLAPRKGLAEAFRKELCEVEANVADTSRSC